MADKTLNSIGSLPSLAGQESQKVVLGANEIPVFMFIGDSTSVGWTSKWDPVATTGDAWKVYRNAPSNEVPEVGSLTLANTPVYGKIWSKFQHHVTGTPDKVDRGIREITGNSTYTPTWQNADCRMGGGGLVHGTSNSLFDYDHESGTYSNKAIIGSPVWNFLQDIYGLFVDSNDDPVLPHVIYLGKASSRFTGGTAASNTTFGSWQTAWQSDTGGSSDLQASTGSLYEFYIEYYVKPSINAIRNAGNTPLMCGLMVACGGNDAGTAVNNLLSGNLGSNMWELAKGYFKDMKEDLCSFIGITDIPVVGYLPWRPEDETVANYDGIKRIRDDFLDLFKDDFAQSILVDPYKLKRDLPSYNGSSDGVHFTPVGTMGLGKMYAAAYRKLLRTKRKTITAEEVTANIT